MMELQTSASKLIGLISGLKNSEKFYKPRHLNASSEQ